MQRFEAKMLLMGVEHPMVFNLENEDDRERYFKSFAILKKDIVWCMVHNAKGDMVCCFIDRDRYIEHKEVRRQFQNDYTEGVVLGGTDTKLLTGGATQYVD